MATYTLKLFPSIEEATPLDGRIVFRNTEDDKCEGILTIVRPDGEEESLNIRGATHWIVRTGTASRYAITAKGEEHGGDIPYASVSLLLSFSEVTLEGIDRRWGIAGQALITQNGTDPAGVQTQFHVFGYKG